VDLDIDDAAIIIEYDGSYIEYKLRVKHISENRTFYKRIFRCFNIEGGTGVIVLKQPEKKPLHKVTAPKKK
jgi:hypothetical protein